MPNSHLSIGSQWLACVILRLLLSAGLLLALQPVGGRGRDCQGALRARSQRRCSHRGVFVRSFRRTTITIGLRWRISIEQVGI